MYGGAGTGKTLVAIEKAKYLATKYKYRNPEDKIIIFTFNKNLAKDIKDKFSENLLKRIEVTNIDSFISSLLISNDRKFLTSVSKIRKQKVQQICGEFDSDFLLDEFDWIRNCHIPLQTYIEKLRIGRGSKVRLDKTKKEKIVKYIKEYRNSLEVKDFYDVFNYFLYDLEKGKEQLKQTYNHVLVDEAQDLSAQHLIFIQYLCDVKTNPCNTITFFLDDKQTIYENKSWIQGGLRTFNMLGYEIPRKNTYKLEACYRSAMEIVSAASSLIGGGGRQEEQMSLFGRDKGLKPFIMKYETEEEEQKGILVSIKKICELGYDKKEIMLITSGNKDSMQTFLRKNGCSAISCYTIRSVKGLENKVVLLTGMNDKRFLNDHFYYDKTLEEQFESSKKIVYVGMTRATELLVISSFGTETELLECIKKDTVINVDVKTEDLTQKIKLEIDSENIQKTESNKYDTIIDEIEDQREIEEKILSQASEKTEIIIPQINKNTDEEIIHFIEKNFGLFHIVAKRNLISAEIKHQKVEDNEYINFGTYIKDYYYALEIELKEIFQILQNRDKKFFPNEKKTYLWEIITMFAVLPYHEKALFNFIERSFKNKK